MSKLKHPLPVIPHDEWQLRNSRPYVVTTLKHWQETKPSNHQRANVDYFRRWLVVIDRRLKRTLNSNE